MSDSITAIRPKNPNTGKDNRADSSPTQDAPLHVSRRLLIERIASNKNLIFNPVSGALDIASDKDLSLLEKLKVGKAVALSRSEEHDLRTRGYVFDTAQDEENLLENAVANAWEKMRTSQPEAYTVCPTLACNLACAYCFEGDSLLDKQQGVMTQLQVSQMFQTISQIRDNYARPPASASEEQFAPWISLFGGEPFLPSTRRCIAQILKEAAAGGFLVGATTNGVNLTRFKDLLCDYADILTVFQVTLDGPKAVHDSRRHRLGGQGTFDEIVNGIDLLLSLQVDVDLRVNLDTENLSGLPDLVCYVHQKGWDKDPGFQMALAPVTVHQSQGCGSRYDKALSEIELSQAVMELIQEHPLIGEICHFGFLRHLEYLVSILEPEKLGHGRHGVLNRIGPRFWYCEASTDKNYVFTPEGLIYSCTESVGHPEHAIGRFDPDFDLWKEAADQWIGRTILSHPKCRSCSISTLCGGGCNFAARERQSSQEGQLIQISLAGRSLTSESPRALLPQVKPDPFCSSSEESVRSYLRYIGGRIMQSA